MIYTYPLIQAEWQEFITMFLQKNSELNLSAIRDEAGVFHKHIADALMIRTLEQEQRISIIRPNDTIIDVGTGGGIPLLPLAMFYPQTHFVGLDSVRKKTQAIADMAEEIGLENVRVCWDRAENHTKQYDVLTARAVAFSETLFSRTYHLVKKGGLFVLYKKKSLEEEIAIQDSIMKKKMTLLTTHTYTLYDGDIARVIYVIKK